MLTIINLLKKSVFKKCTKCGKEKLLFNFRWRNDSKKYRNYCKSCLSIIKKTRRDKNKEAVNKQNREYKKRYKTKELGRLRNSKRRALERVKSDGTITYYSTQQLLSTQGNKCNCCNTDIEYRNNRHLDHIKPLAKGGLHSLSNVQWLCADCNLSKGSKYETKENNK